MQRAGILLFSVLLITAFTLNGQNSGQKHVLESERMRAVVTSEGLVSVTDPGDKHQADIISQRAPWWRVKLVYRSGSEAWHYAPPILIR